jgi:hypothetical protein
LPYWLTIVTEVLRAERPARREVRVAGDESGHGLWCIESFEPGSRVSYRWEIDLASHWMRRPSPLLHPLFAWNHHQAMRSGALGKAGTLGSTSPAYHRADAPAAPSLADPAAGPD